MNVASIDIGSNTVLLLIAEINTRTKDFNPLLNRYEMPRLGKGLDKNGNISEDRINKLINVLEKYLEIIKENKCKKIICTATNAMRIANNSDRIVSIAKKKFNIDIEIISGEREAELSFKGASTVIPEETKKIVLDIGGGSSEVIYGAGNELKFRKSFPIGAVNLTEKFISHSPPSSLEVRKLSAEIKSTFKEINKSFESSIPLIAVAGTPTTLAAIANNLQVYEDNIVEGSKLTLERLDNFIDEFSSLAPAEILEKYKPIINGREDVILAGSLILKQILELTENNYCTVSGKGIRYGSIVDFIENEL